ncbi:MAG: hypothetical protein ACR2I2_03275 [Bryobacteraceae bacterium]
MGPSRIAALFLLGASAVAQAPLGLAELLNRISKDAADFQKVAPLTLSEETLRQRSRPGFAGLLEKDSAAARLPPAPLSQREIVSEYGYASLRNAPAALHEIRKIVRVDGRELSTVDNARHAVAAGLSGDDKQKKRLLEEFEKHGLKGSVTDFGQLLLLFSKRRIGDYDFHIDREARVGVDPVLVLAYRQRGGPESLTVFRGNTAVRQPLTGEIWVRKSDGMPLRITLVSIQRMQHNAIKDEAAVDYSPSPLGAVLPVAVVHREYLNDDLLTENLFRYAPFRRIAGGAEPGSAPPSKGVGEQTVANPPLSLPSVSKPGSRPEDDTPMVKAPIVRIPE